MKHLSLLFILGLFSFSYCYSQNAQVNSGQEGINNTQSMTSGDNMYGSVRTFDNRYEGVEGSPYFSETFRRGTIWLKNGGVKEDVILVFNLSANQLETQVNGMITKISLRIVDRFEMEDSMGINRQFEVRTLVTDKGESEPMALEKLYAAKSLLYRQYYKEFREADYKGSYSSDQRKDQYIDRIKYYTQLFGEPTFTSVRLSRASWQKALSSQKSAIKTYLKQEGLKMEQEAEAVQLLRYFDSLY
ncbi:MAG: hypothetical protein AB8H47_28080 [Bacteroidia bacterium]